MSNNVHFANFRHQPRTIPCMKVEELNQLDQPTLDVLSDLLKPRPRSYYRPLVRASKATIQLTEDEAAVILKAHDDGHQRLGAEDAAYLDFVISKLKDAIYP